MEGTDIDRRKREEGRRREKGRRKKERKVRRREEEREGEKIVDGVLLVLIKCLVDNLLSLVECCMPSSFGLQRLEA